MPPRPHCNRCARPSSARRTRLAARRPAASCGGSAAVELVAVIPFVLVLMAAIWDIRTFVAYRTEVAREMYAVAQLFASGATWTDAGLRNAMQAAQDRLSPNGAGWIRVVVVGRRTDTTPAGGDDENGDGDFSNDVENSAGDWCDATTPTWCDPMILREVRPNPDPTPTQPVRWRNAGRCGTVASQLPAWSANAANRVFSATQMVLPRENVDPDTGGPLANHQQWVSRTLGGEEWWVVMEICSDFGGGGARPGLLGPGFVNLVRNTFDVTGTQTLYNRVAWSGQVPLDECDWCGP